MTHHPDAGQRQILAAIEADRASLMDAARPEAMKRLADRGRLSARTRIERLVDPGTFDEIGALARHRGRLFGAAATRRRIIARRP